jgi:hypothetical protein
MTKRLLVFETDVTHPGEATNQFSFLSQQCSWIIDVSFHFFQWFIFKTELSNELEWLQAIYRYPTTSKTTTTTHQHMWYPRSNHVILGPSMIYFVYSFILGPMVTRVSSVQMGQDWILYECDRWTFGYFGAASCLQCFLLSLSTFPIFWEMVIGLDWRMFGGCVGATKNEKHQGSRTYKRNSESPNAGATRCVVRSEPPAGIFSPQIDWCHKQ